MAESTDLQELLAVYNSISPSRTRWVRNRNELKNRWKELFQALEIASGRDGARIGVFDPNWHEVVAIGGTTGAANKQHPGPIADVTSVVAVTEVPKAAKVVKKTSLKT